MSFLAGINFRNSGLRPGSENDFKDESSGLSNMAKIATLRILTLRKLARSSESDFKQCLDPDILERLSDKPAFVTTVRKAIETRLKIIWKERIEEKAHDQAIGQYIHKCMWFGEENIDRTKYIEKYKQKALEWVGEEIRDNYRYLIRTFVNQVPRHARPYYFSDFGPAIKFDKDGKWMDTEVGSIVAACVRNPLEARTYTRDYERKRKEEIERIGSMFRVPHRHWKKFMEQPIEYVSEWKHSDPDY